MTNIPEELEAVKITVLRITGDEVTFQIRLRGDKNWVYAVKTAKELDSVIVYDGQPQNTGIVKLSPRGANNGL